MQTTHTGNLSAANSIKRSDPLNSEDDADLPPEVLDAIRSNRKVEAIKRLREATGMGLKEAKHAVEDLQRSLGLPDPSTGCSGVLVTVGLIVAGVLIYRYFAA